MKVHRILSFFALSLIFILMISVFTFADDNYDGEDLRGKAQMGKILEAKKEKGKIIIPPYITQPMDGEGLTEEEIESEEFQNWLKKNDRNNEREKIIKQEINPNDEKNINESSVSSYNLFDYILKNKIITLVFLVLFVVIAFIAFATKIFKILFISPLIIIVYVLLLLNNRTSIINNDENVGNVVLEYLKGAPLAKKLEDYSEKYKKEYIDKFNEKEVNLSRIVNDYIIKCYYCVKRKADNKELYSSDIDVLNIFNDDDSDIYYLTSYDGYVDEYNKYSIDLWETDNFLLSKGSMQGIYDNITNDDIDDFNNNIFLDKLVKNIEDKIKSKDDFDAYKVVPFGYFRMQRLDNAPLSKCKYWYLEKGQDITIKLPYGATLTYNAVKYEKKNVKEWLSTTIKKLDNDFDGESSLFAYYIDENDEKKGLCTTIDKDGLYNIKELTDNIRLGNINIYTNTAINEIDNNEKIGNKKKTDVVDIALRFASNKRYKTDRTNEWFTNSFLDKYYENGIMPDLNVDTIIDRTQELINEDNRIKDKYFYEIRFRSSSKMPDTYAIYKIKWQDDKVDDIEYYIVPEDKMNLSYEEMYKLAFND